MNKYSKTTFDDTGSGACVLDAGGEPDRACRRGSDRSAPSDGDASVPCAGGRPLRRGSSDAVGGCLSG